MCVLVGSMSVDYHVSLSLYLPYLKERSQEKYILDEASTPHLSIHPVTEFLLGVPTL
jgi:hypothetical protein